MAQSEIRRDEQKGIEKEAESVHLLNTAAGLAEAQCIVVVWHLCVNRCHLVHLELNLRAKRKSVVKMGRATTIAASCCGYSYPIAVAKSARCDTWQIESICPSKGCCEKDTLHYNSARHKCSPQIKNKNKTASFIVITYSPPEEGPFPTKKLRNCTPGLSQICIFVKDTR